MPWKNITRVSASVSLQFQYPGIHSLLPASQYLGKNLEEVPLASGREGHLPARGERQLVSHVVGLLAEVRVLLRGADCCARACAQLQGRGRRVRADMLGAAGQPGPRVAAGRVGAGLAGVGAGVRLFEERFGQDLLPPRAGLGVHDRVEEGFEVRV